MAKEFFINQPNFLRFNLVKYMIILEIISPRKALFVKIVQACVIFGKYWLGFAGHLQARNSAVRIAPAVVYDYRNIWVGPEVFAMGGVFAGIKKNGEIAVKRIKYRCAPGFPAFGTGSQGHEPIAC